MVKVTFSAGFEVAVGTGTAVAAGATVAAGAVVGAVVAAGTVAAGVVAGGPPQAVNNKEVITSSATAIEAFLLFMLSSFLS